MSPPPKRAERPPGHRCKEKFSRTTPIVRGITTLPRICLTCPRTRHGAWTVGYVRERVIAAAAYARQAVLGCFPSEAERRSTPRAALVPARQARVLDRCGQFFDI